MEANASVAGRGLRKFAVRSAAEQRVLVEAVAALALARMAVRMLPLRRIARLLRLAEGRPATELSSEQAVRARMVGWAVKAAAARVPWTATCLVQAVAASALLRLRGVPVTLHLGVAKDQAPSRGLAAHAWLRCGDGVVVGGPGHARFTVIATYS